jgi:hypothetical protein
MTIKRPVKAALLFAVSLVFAGAIAGTAVGGTNAWQDVWAQIRPLLSDPGTINNAENPVHWTKLKGVPAGLADGSDNGVDRAGFGLKKNLYPNLELAVDTTKIQQRVGGTCPPGQAVGSINADGTVTCAAGAPVVYQGWDEASNTGGDPVGNEWASIGGALNLPAGQWSLAARVSLKGNYDIDYVACQLEAWVGGSRDVRDDANVVVGAPDGLDDDPAIVGLPLQGIYGSSNPFRVAVVCRDSYNGTAEKQAGVRWYSVKILATQASQLHQQRLG